MDSQKKDRYVICNMCKKEIQVRKGMFAHKTLGNHLKEHK